MILNKNYRFYIYIFCIFSLIISSVFNENSSGGSKLDYIITKQYVENFSFNFNKGIKYFIISGQDHSPVFYILASFIEKNLGKFFFQYSYLLISALIPLIFYISLKKKFKKTNKNILFLLSLIIFFSPYFRSSAVWMTTDNLAIIFYILSVNNFLSFKKKILIKTYYFVFYVFQFQHISDNII